MTPPRSRLFAPWPVFEADEIDAVSRVLASGRVNYWTGGECAAFEEEFAAACDRNHGISLANGTLALELALTALGIGPGDEVVVPSRTFIATASCVVARGARPVVADVAAESGNITAETVAAVLTPRTRAVIPVHIAGGPATWIRSSNWPRHADCVSSRTVRRPMVLGTRGCRSGLSGISVSSVLT